MTEDKIDAQAQLEDLHRDRTRAARLAVFLRSDFWKKDLAPYLKDRQNKMAHGTVWKNFQGATLEAIGIATTLNSGRYMEIENLLEELGVWQEKGRLAEEKLPSVTRKVEKARKEASK